jgi:hypothetical protein
MPDVVANVRVDQTWGSFQLSGAVHQISAVGTTNTLAGVPTVIPGIVNPLTGIAGPVTVIPNNVTVTTPGFRPDTEYGYALQRA